MPNKEDIRTMFDDIAANYDKLNHIMSMDIDKIWRQKGIKAIIDNSSLPTEQLNILDLACGTGDFAIALAKTLSKKNIDGKITAVDMSEGMLSIMRQKVQSENLCNTISIEIGDGENLRFADNTFDRVSIAFGIRNFEDKTKGLNEIFRVLRAGGKLAILELSLPENKIVRHLYNLYFLHLLPHIGGKVSGDKRAYNYLPTSVINFPRYSKFIATMEQCGFKKVRQYPLTFGICRLFVGEKENTH